MLTCIKGRFKKPKLLFCNRSVSLLIELVFDMEVDAQQVDPKDASQIRQYRRLLFCVEGNKSVGVQITTINDKLYLGIGKFWRQDGWKADRWAPGKKGSHLYLTVEQYRALVSAVPKISHAVQLVEDLIHIGTNEFEDISVGSGTTMPGTEPASLSAKSDSTAAAAAAPANEPTSNVRGTDACDGEPSASPTKEAAKKAQDDPSTSSKRKRGRPSNVSGSEGVTPKASKSKSSKAKPVAAAAAADVVLEPGASADIVVLDS